MKQILLASKWRIAPRCQPRLKTLNFGQSKLIDTIKTSRTIVQMHRTNAKWPIYLFLNASILRTQLLTILNVLSVKRNIKEEPKNAPI